MGAGHGSSEDSSGEGVCCCGWWLVVGADGQGVGSGDIDGGRR